MTRNGETKEERIWKFQLKDDPKQNGIFCVTGDCDALGNWSTEKIVPLQLDENTRIWWTCICIPANRDVHYRYFSCTISDSETPPKTMLHCWETKLQPRLVKGGVIQNESEEIVDVFGLAENTEKTENGWLTSDLIVQFKLKSSAIQWQTSNDINQKICLKVFPTFRNNKSIQSHRDCLETLIFSFVFEFTEVSLTGTEKNKYYSCLVLENKQRNSDGTVTLPIHSGQHEYMGSLSVKYLIIRPTPDLTCGFKVSYAKFWNNSWTGLEIGHRGSGVSFGKVAAKLRENTIGSFKSAGQCGAHLIEFDVQLTNDLVPTVYHDFHVLLDVRKKNIEDSGRKMIFPFHKLNFEELRDFKIHHVSEINFILKFENDDQEEYSPFPSLEQVLKAIDPCIGFNIEIKYNSELKDGSNELDHPIDMNEYVDRILRVAYANAGRRYIVFSSFNPDVCCMVRMKQNKYPVMFLTQGITKKYPPYWDGRMSSVEDAVRFANSADLLGIVAHSEELLKDYNLVKYVLNNNLVLFCWGDDNNDENNINALKEQGVHGIIFDRIDQYGQKLKKDFSEAVWI